METGKSNFSEDSVEDRISEIREILYSDIDDQKKYDVLKQTVLEELDPEIRAAARRYLDIIARKLKNQVESVNPEMVFQSGNSSEKIQVLKSVQSGALTVSEELLYSFTRNEQDPFVVASCISCIGKVQKPADEEFLRGYLSSTDQRIRANAVEALAGSESENVINNVIQLLSDKDARVRANAAAFLSSARTDRTMAVLEEMIRSGKKNQIESAVYALKGISDQKAEKLLKEGNRFLRGKSSVETVTVYSAAAVLMITVLVFLFFLYFNSQDRIEPPVVIRPKSDVSQPEETPQQKLKDDLSDDSEKSADDKFAGIKSFQPAKAEESLNLPLPFIRAQNKADYQQYNVLTESEADIRKLFDGFQKNPSAGTGLVSEVAVMVEDVFKSLCDAFTQDYLCFSLAKGIGPADGGNFSVSAEGFLKRSIAEMSDGKYSLAEKSVSRAIEIYTEYGEAYFIRGFLQCLSGKTEQGISEINHGISLRGYSAQPCILLGLIHLRTGNNAAAKEMAGRVLLGPHLPYQETVAYYIRGRVYLVSSSNDALSDFRRAAASDPDFMPAVVYKAGIHRKNRDYTSCVRDLSHCWQIMDSLFRSGAF